MTRWRGIHKLTEETGELLQVLGKLAAYPDGNHPDGKGNLVERVANELADVQAAGAYFAEENLTIQRPNMQERRQSKLARFRKWILPGIER